MRCKRGPHLEPARPVGLAGGAFGALALLEPLGATLEHVARNEIAAALARDEEALLDEILVGERDGVARHVQRFGQLAAGGQRAAGGNLPVQNDVDQHAAKLRLQGRLAVGLQVEQLVPHDSGPAKSP